MEDFSQDEMINARDRFRPYSRLEPAVDNEVSKIIGKKVFAQDPRLIGLITKWKKERKNPDEKVPDNFLKDPKKVEQLKQLFYGY